MKTIFKYELQRLVLSKLFIGMALIIGIYGYQVLAGDIVRGVAYTAPFSEWSFGAYMARMLSPLLAALLFPVAALHGAREQKVRNIISSTPVDLRRYLLTRYAAMLTAFLLLTGLAVLVALAFYAWTFKYTAFAAFVAPTIFTVLPGTVFAFGLSLLLAKIHSGILYGLMLLMVMAGQIPLPSFLDYSGLRFLTEAPLRMPTNAAGEVTFFIPSDILWTRVIMVAVGIAAAAISILAAKRNPARTA